MADDHTTKESAINSLATMLREIIADATHWETTIHPRKWGDRYWKSTAAALIRRGVRAAPENLIPCPDCNPKNKDGVIQPDITIEKFAPVETATLCSTCKGWRYVPN